ncbi:SRPBCC family protein [Kutzneria buriramensis]|uniref:Uncharacterized protein YndB with AHSA1/START domain n=1 Tax=Kutzneria buriramensis TaxID=1045776 RepID=A0A3E0I6T9_9PSEU|nr:SRPBCC family protein [Kutzneria buriramensis]REH54347.1 uncharacterized protein YndB with AHSA1/START domain [Kutzneria buriramensis]
MFDVTQQINAVRRQVGSRTLEAGEARTVTVSQTYKTDIDDLWDAVTSAERIGRWFLPVTGDLELGGRYQLVGNAGGTVTACQRPTAFDATWEMGDQVSWIEVRLSTVDDGARFELHHIAVVGDHWDTYGPGAVGIGWDGMLLGLANHLATGEGMSQAEAAAWMATDEAKAFYTASGKSWIEADIASGADPAKAQETGDRTIGFYTGAA